MKNAEVWATFLETEGRQHEIAARLCAEHAELRAAERRFEEFMAVDGRFFRALVKEKNERDLVGQLEYARKMGFKEGLEEARQEDREEGRQEGREEVARNLKAKGLDLRLIVEATGLSEAEVAVL